MQPKDRDLVFVPHRSLRSQSRGWMDLTHGLPGSLVLLLLATALFGCDRRAEPPSLDAGLRWIAEDPEDLLDLYEVSRPAEVETWSFRSAEGLKSWEVTGGQRPVELEDGALTLETSDTQLQMARLLEREARLIARIDVELRGLRTGAMELLWAAEGEPFSPTRSLRLRHSDAVEGEVPSVRVLRFEVARHREWSGRIHRIALRPASVEALRFQIRKITLWSFELDGEAMMRLVERPWKVDRGGEVRNSLLAPPGLPLARAVDLPAEAHLHFGYSLPETFRDPVTFRVLVGTEREEPRVKFSTTLGGRLEAGEDVWHDACVDLSSYAGQTIEVQLESQAESDADLNRGLPAWANPQIVAPHGKSFEHPNVVLISIDTLRADHLSLYGYERVTSPNIDSWARREGVVFRNAIAPASWTLPSHVSLFTGLDALRHQVNHPQRAPASLTMMAELLRDNGYATLAVTDGGYLDAGFGMSQGFDRYRYEYPGVAIGDRLVTALDLSLEWLETHHRQRPFLLFFHTYEVHDPYIAREPFLTRYYGKAEYEDTMMASVASTTRRADDGWRGRASFRLRIDSQHKKLSFEEEDLDLIRALYDGGIAYMDTQIQRLFGKLEELGIDGETIVILTSDHGEALGERGSAGHGHLYDETVRIPLIVASPSLAQESHIVDQQVRLTDVLPTVLELAGIPHSGPLDGVSLVGLMQKKRVKFPREAFSYNSIGNHGVSLRLDNRLKYIFLDAPWLAEREEIYQLSTDVAELSNLAADHKDIAALRKRVARVLEESHSGLRIEIFNSLPQPVHGTLRNRFLRKNNVKSALPHKTLVWKGGAGIEFRLEAGETLPLLLSGVHAETFQFSGFLQVENETPGRPFNITLEKAELLGKGRTLIARNGRLDLRPAGTEAGIGLRFRWTGESEVQPTPAADHAELRKRLKALGYLD